MYIFHSRLCACLSLAAFPHYCMHPDVTWGNGRGCPLVVHYWADLQLVHGFSCYDNIAPNAKCQRVLVLYACIDNGIYYTIPSTNMKHIALQCGKIATLSHVGLPGMHFVLNLLVAVAEMTIISRFVK